MTVQSLEDRTSWEAFLAAVRPPTFLQSWAWGETQRAVGEEVIRLAAMEGEKILGIAQAVTVTARRGKFLHVPHGPVVNGSREQGVGSRETTTALLIALSDEAKRRKSAFLRVSPLQEDTLENRALYRELKFRAAPIHLHAERLWLLDVTPSEETLLAGMRKTTRNLVRRAMREDVTVRFENDVLEVFLQLYAETARRERFVQFSRKAIAAEAVVFSTHQAREKIDFTVLRKTVKSGGPENSRAGSDILVGVAEHRGEPIAAAVVPLTPWSAFYHHGASVRMRENVPASYALHWALIREAKRRGCREYNFWGIAPRHPRPDTRHPWYGLTLFKTGFGGREVALVPTQDLPLSPRYWAAYALDRYRRWQRGI